MSFSVDSSLHLASEKRLGEESQKEQEVSQKKRGVVPDLLAVARNSFRKQRERDLKIMLEFYGVADFRQSSMKFLQQEMKKAADLPIKFWGDFYNKHFDRLHSRITQVVSRIERGSYIYEFEVDDELNCLRGVEQELRVLEGRVSFIAKKASKPLNEIFDKIAFRLNELQSIVCTLESVSIKVCEHHKKGTLRRNVLEKKKEKEESSYCSLYCYPSMNYPYFIRDVAAQKNICIRNEQEFDEIRKFYREYSDSLFNLRLTMGQKSFFDSMINKLSQVICKMEEEKKRLSSRRGRFTVATNYNFGEASRYSEPT